MIEAEKMRVVLAGEAGVAECLLRRVRTVLEAAAEVRDPEAERVPDVNQAGVVPRLHERRQGLPREPLELVDGRVGCDERAVVGGADAAEQFACFVAGRACPFGGGVGDRGGLRGVPLEVRLGEVELEHHVEPRRPGQTERPLEQPFGGPAVAAPERAAAGDREPLTGALSQGRVGLSELLLVAGGLLEVVAEDLVELDQVGGALLQPVGEALVEVGTDCLRQRVVSGVADQQVAEAEGVVAWELRAVGADELLADERERGAG